VSTTSNAQRTRRQRGWVLYDVANSVFVTTVVAALAGPFLLGLAEDGAGPDGEVHLAGLAMAPGAFVAYTTTVAALVQVVVLPLLGAVVDASGNKRGWLTGAALTGAALTLVLAVLPAGAWLAWAAVYAGAVVAFSAAMVPYNAMLSEVAEPEERDRLSARGFAYGYASGGLLLTANLVLVQSAGSLGLTTAQAARIDMVSVAVWWAVLTLVARRSMPGPVPGEERVPTALAVRRSAHELRASLADLGHFGDARRYLLSFLLWSDGLQGVSTLSGVFVVHELFVARGRPEDDGTPFVMLLVLVLQFAAVPGALVFARLARRWGARRVLLGSLVGWVGIVAYAWLLSSTTQAIGLAVAIAVVMGGSQALGRSLFAQLIPAGRESSWMGLYQTAERGTSWIAPLLFGLALDLTGSYRVGIGSLVLLFIGGLVVLAATDTARGTAAAHATLVPQQREPAEATPAPPPPRAAGVRRASSGTAKSFLPPDKGSPP
jgi:MFS-type transporter involved in bile tolerance (Atg22 family)